MFLEIVANILHRIFQLLTLLVVVHVILSYFMSPYHPIRQYLDRLVEPMLRPIRRFIPLVGVLDFSPLILIIIIQILDAVVTALLSSV